jgi:hypothetical protein
MASRTHGKPRALGWVALVGVSCALAFPALALAAYPGANGRIALTVRPGAPTAAA